MPVYLCRILLILFAGWLNIYALVAAQPIQQNTQIRFHTLSLDEGLSQSTVNDVMQDRLGFIWIATQDGINRYDGYEFKTYRHLPNDPNSLSSSWTTCLQEDSTGAIWIGTYGRGLNRFDPVTEQFQRYRAKNSDPTALSNGRINCLYIDRQNRLWIGTQQGLNIVTLSDYDSSSPDSINFKRISTTSSNPFTLAHNNVTDIKEDDTGNILIATLGGGVTMVSPDLETSITIRNTDTHNILPSNYIRTIYTDHDNQIWVGSDGSGIAVINQKGQQLKKFTTETSMPLSGNNIRAIYQDHKGNMWIGTGEEGLTRLNLQKNQVTHYRADSDDPFSISHNTIYTIEEDSDHNLWFGTFLNGISTYTPRTSAFNHLAHNSDDTNSLSYNMVSSIYEDPSGIVWIGTRGGGLDKYNIKTNTFTHYSYSAGNPNSISSDNVRYVYPAGENKLWIGTWGGGLDLFDKKNGKLLKNFSHDPDDPTSIQDDRIRVIYKDSYGNLWVATGETERSALNLYKPENQSFKKFTSDPENPYSLPNNTVNHIYETPDSSLWIASYGGLSRVISDLSHPDSLKMITYHSGNNTPEKIAGNIVSSIYGDNNGTLWAASYGAGLNKIVSTQKGVTDISHLGKQEGLANTGILSLTGDEEGRLWMGTNHGLIMYDVDKKLFRNFTLADGLQNKQFNQASFHRGHSGRLYFGGAEGLTYFHPDSLNFRTESPPVYLTSFQIFDQPASIDSNITYKTRVSLEYHQNFFSFKFAALDFEAQKKTNYFYKLEGFNENWINSETRNYASYTNLDPGTYTFTVKPTTPTGKPATSSAMVDVVITPPFWMTNMFRFAVLLVLTGLIWTGIKIREKRLRKLNVRLEKKVREQTSKLRQTASELKKKSREAIKANKAKSEFLAGISHELRTPLNAIIGFSQILSQDKSIANKHSKFIETIYRSAKHLLNMINDVLDISKIEAGRMQLHPDTFSLPALTTDLYNMFKIKCDEKGLEYNFNIAEELPEYIHADAGKIRQILINLIGNAVKYTTSGSITFTIKQSEKPKRNVDSEGIVIQFEIEDTGKGISKEKQKKIFTPFTRDSHSSSEGTGLGLAITKKLIEIMEGELHVKSTLGEGSTFLVQLPVIPAEPPEKSADAEKRYLELDENQKIDVLIADDVWYNLTYINTLLKQVGFTTYQAQDGKEAVDKFRRFKPEVVILDIKMPQMDGVEAMSEIRKLQESQTFIIAVSASVYGTEGNDNELLENGFDAFLMKPFHIEDLLQILEQEGGYSFKKPEGGEADDNNIEESDNLQEVTEAITNLPSAHRRKLMDAIELLDFEKLSKLCGNLSGFPYANVLSHAAKEKNYRYLLTLTELIDSEDL